MFVIWRGWGILLPVGALIGAFIGALISTALLGPQSTAIMPAIIGIFATLGAYLIVRLLEKTDKGRAVIDKASGEEILLKRGDSLFFIPVRWWFYLLAVVTVISLVLGIYGLASS